MASHWNSTASETVTTASGQHPTRREPCTVARFSDVCSRASAWFWRPRPKRRSLPTSSLPSRSLSFHPPISAPKKAVAAEAAVAAEVGAGDADAAGAAGADGAAGAAGHGAAGSGAAVTGGVDDAVGSDVRRDGAGDVRSAGAAAAFRPDGGSIAGQSTISPRVGRACRRDPFGLFLVTGRRADAPRDDKQCPLCALRAGEHAGQPRACAAPQFRCLPLVRNGNLLITIEQA